MNIVERIRLAVLFLACKHARDRKNDGTEMRVKLQAMI